MHLFLGIPITGISFEHSFDLIIDNEYPPILNRSLYRGLLRTSPHTGLLSPLVSVNDYLRITGVMQSHQHISRYRTSGHSPPFFATVYALPF